MTLQKLFLCFSLCVCQFISAQNDSITKLKEVVVSDNNFKKFSTSQSVLKLNDSIINKNEALLTDLLNFNSVIYFKEYGRGMLSTVSFRGTTASQTAVIWNGININSQMNGSTDFNTISASDYNSINVKAGGGSVIYGSGAIGGTVHLNNDLSFNNQFDNSLKLYYGSFNTIGVNYKMNVSNEKWSTQIGFSKNSSTNDYLYLNKYNWRGEQRRNRNGQYDVMGLNADFGYKINKNNILKLYSQTSNTDRNTSLVSESETKSKYINGFSRNLIEYNGDFDKLTTNFKTAYIFENYQYFADIDRDYYSYGKTESLITKLDLGCQLLKSIQINGVLDYNRTKGYGTSFGNHIRELGSFAFLAKQQVNTKWQNEFGIRKEFNDVYKSPVLFSLGSSYAFNKFYNLKLNLSRNFRIPTYNDLYWEEGGNPDLKPESSYQAEIGNVFSYKKITFSQTVYYIKIKDLLRWIPGKNGIWAPQNTEKVNACGAETILSWKNNYGKNYFSANATYAYTISKNEETNKQLFFVPFNKVTGAVAYAHSKISINYQFLYNGFVYTRSDNDPKEIIDDYMVSNIGIDYDLKFLSSFKLGFQILNVFNKEYQSLEDRPMPGRNYNMYLILKF
ncbi:TonB-dependent receptor plug domain-containing protein [Flavobacterium gawalongense]|uniref:TonB-dependent receptor n=1 Tax=Flavobacterium gawalongense TaxID=2594432 RepID=A0A553BE11_9FLAO|nr:TonB-dependent receptor [Flavobacterium gawalongense]TRW98903.1 TonB-dependent receptor [Flavobacterium gawalongense]TRX03512.1 TonB-dependent receptor [Flavobacterium gawalongense]TRX06475.1 TonB-dependent receptor [Flavobacterium gawalongense]TRX07300.1 TonB-dependent receptor [Flavobacterium gawalongense]TRX24996.1 TonB-dependent receptor [Flavobacterium gawalongense]